MMPRDVDILTPKPVNVKRSAQDAAALQTATNKQETSERKLAAEEAKAAAAEAWRQENAGSNYCTCRLGGVCCTSSHLCVICGVVKKNMCKCAPCMEAEKHVHEENLGNLA
jgi:hypothetical protein